MAIIPGVYQAKNAISDDSQQGSKFNSIVNAIVNPANTSLLTGFDPVIEEVSSPNAGTVVTYMPHSVSGTPPLTLPNSAGQPLQAWSVDLLPYQEGTGDPSPTNVRPIHGTDKLTITTAGKNLFDKTSFSSETGSTITYRSYQVPNGTYTMSTPDFPYMLGTTNVFFFAGSVSSGASSDINGVSVKASRTVIVTDGYITVASRYQSASNMYHPIDYNWQIEVGSTVSDYTPYVSPSQTVLTLPQTVYTGTIGSEGGREQGCCIRI